MHLLTWLCIFICIIFLSFMSFMLDEASRRRVKAILIQIICLFICIVFMGLICTDEKRNRRERTEWNKRTDSLLKKGGGSNLEMAVERLIELKKTMFVVMYQELERPRKGKNLKRMFLRHMNAITEATAGDDRARAWLTSKIEGIKEIKKRDEIQKMMISIQRLGERDTAFGLWLKIEIRYINKNPIENLIVNDTRFRVWLNNEMEGIKEIYTAIEGGEQTSVLVPAPGATVEKEDMSKSLNEEQAVEPANTAACDTRVHACDLLNEQPNGKKDMKIGVAVGLLVIGDVGFLMDIETEWIQLKNGNGELKKITGSPGNVMKESATVAHTLARRILREKDPKNFFFANNDIHMHIPEGATKKEGPSAGCAMVTSLLSLALKKPVSKDLAMTGEVRLDGTILKVGWILKKIKGVMREKVTRIILPSANRDEFADIASIDIDDFGEIESIDIDGLVVYFVDNYHKIYDLVFGNEKRSEK